MKTETQIHMRNQKGYSLVELSVALSIVAVVIVAGLMGARQVMLSNTINNQIRESNQTIAKLRKAMANQTSTDGLDNDVARKLGVWPNDRDTCASKAGTSAVAAVTTCKNRAMFNGAFEYAFTNDAISGMAANTGVMYVLYNIPSQACTDLVNGLNGAALALYAGPTGTEPTSGKVSADAVTVKAGGASNISLPDLAKGCDSTKGFSDIYAVVQL
jgi:prepilin-type N-terminal cleavage/methylation domain-containing protein